MSDPTAALRAISGAEPSDTAVGLPNIPAVPFTDDASLTNFLQSAKLWMEKAMGAGLTGFATKKDLIRNGLLGTDAKGNLVPTGGVPNLAIPPVPTGLQANGAMTNILLEWDNPFQAYGNHGYTEIWAAETNNFTNAVLVGESGGFTFPHAVGEDSTRYYWIRFVSSYGIKGPYNSVNGTLGQTAPNPQYLLDTLTGRLTESQLYADLNSRINLIDGPSTTIGTIPFQLAQLQGQINDLSNYPPYDNATTYLANDIVTYNGAIYKANQTTTGNLPTNTTYWLKIGDYSSLADAVAAHTTQIATLTSNDSAQASQITTLFTQVGTKSTIYRQPTAPTSPQLNDIWIDTSTSYSPEYFLDDYGIQRCKQYMWDGVEWLLITDDRIWDTQSALATEQTTRASADTALTNQITSLTATVEGYNATTNAALVAEQTTRANADSALSQQITTLNATVETNQSSLLASLQTEQTTRANADTALSQQITTLTATVNGNQFNLNAAIQSEATARANADSALTTQVNTAYSAATKTRTYSQNDAPTSGMIEGDLWFDANDGYKAYRYTGTQWSPTDDTRIAGSVAAIQTEQTTRATADSALATQINTLSSTVDGYNSTLTAAIQSEASTRSTADSALSTQINTVAARLNTGGDISSAIVQSQTTANTAVSNASTAQGTADSKVKTFFQTSPPAASTTGDLWIDTDDNNRIYRWNGSDWVDAADARIAATASQVTTLQTTVAGHTTSIQTQAETIDGIEGKYAVKIDNNGYVTGYGLISTNNTGTPTSEFMVVADKFSIAPVATDPATADGSPFFHLTSPTTINGVEVPAGTYMKSAYIHDAAITNAKIANLSADKITAGYLSADRLASGSVTSSKIDATNLTAKNASIVDGWFSGTLNGAVGTFSGVLSAGVLNSAAFDSYQYVYQTPGTFNLAVPALKSGWSAMRLRLTLVGAGGGGGGAWAQPSVGTGGWLNLGLRGGSGGGAGSRILYDGIVASPGQVVDITIGAGGVGGVSSVSSTSPGSSTDGQAGSVTQVVYSGVTYSVTAGTGGGRAAGPAGVTGGAVASYTGAGGTGGSSWIGVGGTGDSITGAMYDGGGTPVLIEGTAAGLGAGGGGAAAGYAYLGYSGAGGTTLGSVGNTGGSGYVLLEFYDPNTIVLNSRYSNLILWLDNIGKGAVPANAR